MAKGDDIEERLIKFAVRIIKVADKLPKTPAGRHIADQLLRAGTAPAFHYGEGRSAEQKRFCAQIACCPKRNERDKNLPPHDHYERIVA